MTANGRRHRVILDCDGVLSDFVGGAIEVFADLTGHRYRHEDFKKWELSDTVGARYKAAFYERCRRPGWCANLQAYEGAREFVDALRRRAEVYVVTSPLPGAVSWMHERTEWLTQLFDFDAKHVVHTSAKHLIEADAFLDDKPEHVEDWIMAHPRGTGVVLARPYNAHARTIRVPDYATALVYLLQPNH